MPRVTIELDDHALDVARQRAREANVTLSQWISDRIIGRRRPLVTEERDAMGYPVGWFESTYGSLADLEDFCEPPDSPP